MSNKPTVTSSLAALPTSSSLIKIVRYVSTCRKCLMITICEKKRQICPFCASFYDFKMESNHKLVKMKKACSNDLSDDSDDENDGSNDSSKTNGAKIKEFFFGLFKFKTNATKSKCKSLEKSPSYMDFRISEMRKKQNDDLFDLNHINDFSQYEIIEHTDLTHPFLTIKNKNLSLFENYQNQFIRNQDEFRFFFKFLSKLFLFFNYFFLLMKDYCLSSQ